VVVFHGAAVTNAGQTSLAGRHACTELTASCALPNASLRQASTTCTSVTHVSLAYLCTSMPLPKAV
jgi:hypothetical protein